MGKIVVVGDIVCLRVMIVGGTNASAEKWLSWAIVDRASIHKIANMTPRWKEALLEKFIVVMLIWIVDDEEGDIIFQA